MRSGVTPSMHMSRNSCPAFSTLPLRGGALDEAAKMFRDAADAGVNAKKWVTDMKKEFDFHTGIYDADSMRPIAPMTMGQNVWRGVAWKAINEGSLMEPPQSGWKTSATG